MFMWQVLVHVSKFKCLTSQHLLRTSSTPSDICHNKSSNQEPPNWGKQKQTFLHFHPSTRNCFPNRETSLDNSQHYSSNPHQPINTNKVLPLIPVFVSSLIISTTNPFSWATDRTHCKTSSRIANTYNSTHTILVFKGTFILSI